MKKVLVTGANGHLGYNLTRLLVDDGYQVRVSVRDKNNSEKTRHLQNLGVEIVEADIMNPQSLKKAMCEMDGVFQVAAVYNLTAKNPERNVKYPIITGGLNVIEAAKEEGVRKVVFTSSIVALGTVAPGDLPLTEERWNDQAIEPYAQAKTEVEKRAWEFATKNQLNMVAILPSAMTGPGFYRHTPSTIGFEQLLRGQVPFILPLTLEFVDVRDVARAHILAYENDRASGRYIASCSSLSMADLYKMIQEIDPEIKIPSRTLPRGLLKIVPLLDWLGNKLIKTPRFATREFIKEYGYREQSVSNRRAKTELGWKPIPLQESIRDTVAWVKETFIGTAI
jgi:dihydroflavonol-4-reductase